MVHCFITGNSTALCSTIWYDVLYANSISTYITPQLRVERGEGKTVTLWHTIHLAFLLQFAKKKPTNQELQEENEDHTKE